MAVPTIDLVQISETRRSMTFDEYLRTPDEGQKAEWVNGEVIVYMPASVKHQALIVFLAQLLGLFVRLFDLGIVLTDRIAMRALPEGAAREPDVLFVAREHQNRLTPKYLAGPADLVVEIISDESEARDRTVKFNEYQAAGIREYLLVDAREGKGRVDYYALGTDGKYEPIEADAEGKYHSTVLAGFWFRAEWLLRDELPDPLDCLIQIAPDALRKKVGLKEGEDAK